MTEIFRTVGSLVVALTILSIAFGATMSAVSTAETIQTGVGLGADGQGQITQVEDPTVTNAQQSLGTGVNLSGGSYQASGVAALEPPFTVTVWAESRTNSSDQTVYSIDSDNQLALSYNSTANEYRAYWFNDASRESALATVAASDVTLPTVLAVRHDGSTINVSANGTTGPDSAPAVAGGTAQDAGGWLGQQDELRVFDGALGSIELSVLQASPTDAITTTATASRIMFDARASSVSSRPVYFSGGSVDLSGVGLVDTVAGQPTDGNDYQLSGDSLTATAGGTLAGQPVVFVTADGQVFAVGSLVRTLVAGAVLIAAAGAVLLVMNMNNRL